MPAKIPAHVREQQINDMPNIRFVRWLDCEYRGARSRAVCRCAVDGFEWSASVNNLIHNGSGCPQCAGVRRRTADECEQKINNLPNITFVRWDGEYTSNKSKAVVRCTVDGHEWSASVSSLLNGGRGCPQCAVKTTADKRRRPSNECVGKINSLTGIIFIRWHDGEYSNVYSKAVCRCTVDGYEWSTSVGKLLNNGTGCPQCAVKTVADKQRRPSNECVGKINALPNITFVRWNGEYRNKYSKAVCRCDVDGHEWSASVASLLNNGTGCPQCAEYGYNPSKPGTLYALRSECGAMVKIGISNDYQRRHRELASTTPFAWECIELIHGDGAMISRLEKAFHGLTEPVVFKEPFDGYTEWGKWDNRIPEWFSNWREMVQCR